MVKKMKKFLYVLFLLFVLVSCQAKSVEAVSKAKVIYHYKTVEPYLALTFDDGPNKIQTPKVLKILDKYDVKATFFVVGENIEYKKELSDGSVMECYNKTTKTSARSITVKYILSNGTKTIFVVKEYSKESYNDQEQNIPTSISLLGNIDGDQYFNMHNVFEAPQLLGHEISEDLTDEFLFGFNVEIVERS